MTIEQIVSAAGNGVLRDASACSDELRTYLTQVPSAALGRYIDYCLSNAFKVGGIVLQDLINEVGRRLDYEVSNGRYQGTPNHIGYDGLWRSPEGNHLVLEVKTTDAYRIPLDVIAAYRTKLIAADELNATSSILIVVGREDTGELEAQIRGSKHAWDVRLISAEALLKLLQVKENSNESETGTKVRSLFAPVEYTRLDRMVDVVFTAATDVEVAPEGVSDDVLPLQQSDGVSVNDPSVAATPSKQPYQFTDSALLQAKRLEIIAAFGAEKGTHLLQKSRAQYWNAGRDVRTVCSISKRYEGKNQNPYWYAYHPQWDAFLSDAKAGFFILGCMDSEEAFAIPRPDLLPILPKLHQTQREQGPYWHIHLIEEAGGIAMLIPGAASGIPLQPYSFRVGRT